MNLQLANTEEFIEGQFTGNLGEVLIRCGNSHCSLMHQCSMLSVCCPEAVLHISRSHCGYIQLMHCCYRCNNVLYMRGVPEEGEGGEDGEAKLMEA